MGVRSRSLAAVAAAIFLASMPVQAQDSPSVVSFQGISFAFDRTLGTNVNIMEVPGDPPAGIFVSSPGAGHLAFSLYRTRRPEQRLPRPFEVPGTVSFYRVSDLAEYVRASQQLEDLKSLLDERPDLDALTASDAETSSGLLPFMLTDAAAQLIDARGRYIDTPELSGVAYLTVLAQDLIPFGRDDFWYTFQGLSADGQWYVTVDFQVEAGMFPARVTRRTMRRVVASADAWMRYRDQSIQTLNGAPDDAFTPSLATIDELVRSITFDRLSPTDSRGG